MARLFPLLLLLLLATAPNALAFDREIRQPTNNPSGLLYVTPNQVEIDVVGGERSVIEVELFNDDPDQVVDVSMLTADLGPASDPKSLADRVEDGEFGAGDWVSFEVEDVRLQPFEAITFEAYIDPPDNAPIGTNLGAISVRATGEGGEIGANDNSGAVQVDAIIQLFLTIPGPIDHDLKVTDVDVRDTLLLGSHRFAIYELTFTNNGTVNEHVSGTLDIKSLFGNTAHRAKIDDLIVLRGSTRTTRVVWRDLPWVGMFTPHARVRGDDAKLQTAVGERIYIMPWWLPVIVVLGLLLPPLFVWWRRRREWKHYLDDEDIDDSMGDWHDDRDGDLVGGR